ncbi:hypothetical protein PHMEG_00028042 [Phytophthora megakarya]|uniref:Retrotransposon gag domain-containing protein n=1 Tax=Phytophthora megakarya TaxID=4795 RepID=A0A225V8E2_9STRA|nr:hypothetical protein PHMEG_00028042 [Phytophthora megakarya]
MWYDTVEDAFSRREDQTFGNLSRMMKDRYMVKRSNPEVVARLRQRRQQRGESLVEYAQKLREIASTNPVDEEWRVDSFLSVTFAVDQVGEYGEGYGVDLARAMRVHDERTASAGATPTATSRWHCSSRWKPGNALFPAGYRLVPEETTTAGQAASTTTTATPTRQTQNRQQNAPNQRTDGNNQQAQRPGRALQMEAQGSQQSQQQSQQRRWNGDRNYGNTEPLRTKENRLRNHQQYLDRRSPQQQPARTSTARSDDVCFYCHGFGHHAHVCALKKEDKEESSPVVNQSSDTGNQTTAGSTGNGQRM